MTLVSSGVENTSPKTEREPGQYSARRLRITDDAFGDWLTLRESYMNARGWSHGSEFDTYDEDPRTAHILIDNSEGKTVLGMRLTPLDAGVGDGMMSWNMVADSTIHRQIQESAASLSGSQIWDLTRLVPGPGLTGGRDQFLEAAPILFKEGYKYCLENGHDIPQWFFAIDIATHRSLSDKNLPIAILGKGKVGTDTHDTLFGYVLPSVAQSDTSVSSEMLSAYRGSE